MEEIQKYQVQNTSIVPHISFPELIEMSKHLAHGQVWGMSEGQILSLMLEAQADGDHPVMARRNYHLMKGKPTMKAEAMQARFQAAGGFIKWLVVSDVEVTAEFSHQSSSPVTISWTIEMAKRAGLTGNVWEKYPRAMLRNRCVSEGIRTCYPGVVLGIYTPEEVESFTPSPIQIDDDGVIIDVTPTPKKGYSADELFAELTGRIMKNNNLADLSELEYCMQAIHGEVEWKWPVGNDMTAWGKLSDEVVSFLKSNPIPNMDADNEEDAI